MVKILLLGATGSLGRVILRQLLADARHSVTALVRSPDKLAAALGADTAAARNLTTVKGDILSGDTLAELMRTHGVCICTAGRPNTQGNDLEPIVAAVVREAAQLLAPRKLILLGGVGALSAPGALGPSGLLPLMPPVVRGYTEVHLRDWALLQELPPSVSWTLLCPGFMSEGPASPVPVRHALDVNPLFNGATVSRVLAALPAHASAAYMGLNRGRITVPYEDVAALAVQLMDATPGARYWGHRVGFVRDDTPPGMGRASNIILAATFLGIASTMIGFAVQNARSQPAPP
jgi:putative NADH-flavin reductase